MENKTHISITERSDLTLYLIREELKSRKFFSGLQRLGLDYCFYQPCLDKPILAAAGFDKPSDEVYQFYFKLIEKRSRKIREDEELITKQAKKVYERLMAEGRTIKSGGICEALCNSQSSRPVGHFAPGKHDSQRDS